MQRGVRPTTRLARLALPLAVLVIAGCATQAPEPTPVEPPPLEVVVESTIPIIEPTPPPPVVEPPSVTPPSTVAIVLSSRQAAYEDVVIELEKHFEAYSIYDLSDKSQPPVAAFRLINDSDSAVVVAIGLRAAISAVELANVPVIFSQVFNYQDYGLVTEASRGVAAIAPLDAQIAAWKDVNPTVSEIGIIIGEGHEDLIAEAEIAAERHAVSLNIRTAHSDQETLFLFKRMIQNIDGFWLFPDNRILSARVLRDILQDTRRRRVAAVVPNDSMLSMGAAISITTVPSDVAEKIANIVRLIQADRFVEVPSLTPLSEIRVATNDALLQKPVVASEAEIAQGTPQ